jgi:hypothetical protein
MLTGGCYCGAVRYETDADPFDETACHCSICRRTTGAPFLAWFSVRRSGFRFTEGTPARFRSSARAVRAFCARCGTQIAFERDDLPGEIDVATCSLDEPDRVPPRDHIYTSSKPVWVKLDDGLLQYPEAVNRES